MSTCPPECHEELERHSKDIDTLFLGYINPWARTMIFAAIFTLFGLLGTNYLYGVNSYSSKDEARTLKDDIKMELREIKDQIKELRDDIKNIRKP